MGIVSIIPLVLEGGIILIPMVTDGGHTCGENHVQRS